MGFDGKGFPRKKDMVCVWGNLEAFYAFNLWDEISQNFLSIFTIFLQYFPENYFVYFKYVSSWSKTIKVLVYFVKF